MGVMPLAGERYIIKKQIIVPDVLVCVQFAWGRSRESGLLH